MHHSLQSSSCIAARLRSRLHCYCINARWRWDQRISAAGVHVGLSNDTDDLDCVEGQRSRAAVVVVVVVADVSAFPVAGSHGAADVF